MATPFALTRDINGFNGFGLPFTSDKYSATLTTLTDTTLTVPGSSAMGAACATTYNKFIAIFSYEPGASVWVALNETAAVPAGSSFASTTSELLPSARSVQDGDVLHFYSSDDSASVGVTFYALF